MNARTAGGFPTAFPAAALRSQFPALQHASHAVFFDNAAGAQVPQMVLDAVNHHLIDHNVQRGGRYSQSVAVDETIARARASVAVFVNARRADEIAFGMNATSFIRIISLAVGQTLGDRNEIIVTDLDHEANVATWLALEKMGAEFRWWKMRDDGCLHADDLRPLLSSRTRLVACTLTSNALGSIVDVRAAADLVHSVGAEIFLDSVHYGPHGPIDVQAFDCDYLVCSGYKIFAPHMGFMWGRYESLVALPTFREDFIPDEPPGKIEAGTFIYENVAGMDAAIAYLAQLGAKLGGPGAQARRAPAGPAGSPAVAGAGGAVGASNPAGAANAKALRADLDVAMHAIRDYERTLSLELIRVLKANGAKIYGIDTESRIAERVPTICFNMPGVLPQAVVEAAARADIGIRDGHMYSPRLMKRLGLAKETGVVRVSLVHYNTFEEIQRFADVLARLR